MRDSAAYGDQSSLKFEHNSFFIDGNIANGLMTDVPLLSTSLSYEISTSSSSESMVVDTYSAMYWITPNVTPFKGSSLILRVHSSGSSVSSMAMIGSSSPASKSSIYSSTSPISRSASWKSSISVFGYET